MQLRAPALDISGLAICISRQEEREEDREGGGCSGQEESERNEEEEKAQQNVRRGCRERRECR